MCMKVTKKAETEKPSIGTQMGQKLRARCNDLTEAERETLILRGMQMLYGKPAKQVHASRR